MTLDESPSDTGFLGPYEPSPAADRLFATDREDMGYVMNLSHAWAHQPAALDALMGLLGHAAAAAGLTFRQRGLLVTAVAGALGDPHCGLAWGTRLAGEIGDGAAAAVLRGEDGGLEPGERSLARWARQLVLDPGATTAADVQALREAGFTDSEIVALTLYASLRMAFSTVNDALGARPDLQLLRDAPAAVAAAVTFGRPPAAEPSG
jgi:alkylhydroperoxidase family enzyme